MGDGATLYIIIWLLYLSECFVWVGRQSVPFVSPWLGKWRIGNVSSFLANSRGAVLVLNPLFPATRALVGSVAPVSVSPAGICAFNAQTFFDRGRPIQPAHYFAFEDIRSCNREDRRLVVNQVNFADCANAAEAQRLSAWINELVRTPAGQRERAIRQFIGHRFAKTEALELLGKALIRLRALSILCVMFFPLLFIGAPAAALRYGLEEVIIPGGIVMLAFAAAIAGLFFYHHKALWPAAASERYAGVVKIIFCPPGAISAVGHLTANLLAAFDPLVIASLLAPDARARFASAYVRDLICPVSDGLDPEPKKVVDWHRSEILRLVLEYLKRDGNLRSNDCLKPPAQESTCQSYCPRCHSQFTVTEGQCSGCDGVPLLRLGREVASNARMSHD